VVSSRSLQCVSVDKGDYILFTNYYLLITIMSMEYKHTPPSLLEIREARKPIRRVTKTEVKSGFSSLEKFALTVTKAVGTMGFFFVLTVWTIGWLMWNLWGPLQYRFDPAPAFVLWLFTSNIIQLVLLPLIMVGQNLEGKFAESRAQADYDINKKAEHEVEVVIAHLENQNELLLEILRKMDRTPN
jgi:uncharacterized membrane protein